MNYSESIYGNLLLLEASGRADLSSAEEFGTWLASMLSKSAGIIIIDFSGIDYISSAGLRSLMIAYKRCKTERKVLALAALQPLVREIFAISRFDLVFPLFETVQEAVQMHAPETVLMISDC